LSQKKDAAGVVDTISAEEFGKFPDINLSGSLQRIPGMTLNRDDGDRGQAINLRGLSPGFTRVEINDKALAHGGMDFIMLWRLVSCLKNGLPLDQNVYDAASWSVVVDLSERSVTNKSSSVDFPDFTRGKWVSNEPL
jgi:hypothetical protein